MAEDLALAELVQWFVEEPPHRNSRCCCLLAVDSALANTPALGLQSVPFAAVQAPAPARAGAALPLVVLVVDAVPLVL